MIEDFYADAIDTVSTWDIDPGDFADTVNALPGCVPGTTWTSPLWPCSLRPMPSSASEPLLTFLASPL